MTPEPTTSATAGPPTPFPTESPFEGRTVTSDDNLLTLDIPEGAAVPDLPISATAKGKADLPPELAGVNVRSAFYDLEPDGTQFNSPITVLRAVSLSALGVDPTAKGYPIIRLANRSSDGTWAWLDDQEQTVTPGDTIDESATLNHFSELFGFNVGEYLHVVTPPPPQLTLNQPYQIKLDLSYTSGLPAAKRPSVDRYTAYTNAPGIEFGQPQIGTAGPKDQPFSYTVTCRTPGMYELGGNIVFKNFGELPDLGLGASGLELYLRFKIACAAPPPPPLVFLIDGCVSVDHTALGAYPSHLRWVLDFSFDKKFNRTGPSLAITYDEGGTPLTFSGLPITIDSSGEGTATVDTGITDYGKKNLDGMSVQDSGGQVTDLTQAMIGVFGENVTVTATPGTLAGNNC